KRRTPVVAKVVEGELQAYEKHQQHEADLAENRKDLRHRRIKDSVEQRRKHSTKERRPECQSRSDLATYEGLSDSPEQGAKYPRRGDDRDQLHNNDQENILDVAASRCHGS